MMCIGPVEAKMRGQRVSGIAIVRAVDIGFDPAGQRSVGQPLEARRPGCAAQPGHERLARHIQRLAGPRASARRDWRCGPGARRASAGTRVGSAVQSRPSSSSRAPAASAVATIAASASLAAAPATTSGSRRLAIAAFSAGDLAKRVAEVLLMVEADRARSRTPRGCSTTLVASSRPPSPTSRIAASARARGRRRGSRPRRRPRRSSARCPRPRR